MTKVAIPAGRMIFWFGQLILAVLLAFLFERIVIFDFERISITRRNVRAGSLTFPGGRPQTYLLKIWNKPHMPDRVTFNDRLLVHSHFNNRPKMMEFYYLIRPSWVMPEKNILKIEGPGKYSLRFSNHLASSNFGVIFIKSGTRGPARRLLVPLVVFFALLRVHAFLCRRLLGFFDLPLERYTLHYFLSFVPCLVFFVLCDAVSTATPLALLMFPHGYFGICLFSVFCMQVLFFSVILGTAVQKQGMLAKSIERVKGYESVRRWLALDAGDKAVIIFLGLIFVMVFLSLLGMSFLTELLANIAYLVLIFGVARKIFTHARPS